MTGVFDYSDRSICMTQLDEDLDLLTSEMAAKILHCKPQSVADKCRSGEIKAEKPDKTWLITKSALRAYIYGQGTEQDVA